MSSTIKTGSYRQSDTTRCLPKQGIISAQLSQVTRKVKQNNGKENMIIRLAEEWKGKCVKTQNSGVYPSQGQAEQDIHDKILGRKLLR